MNVRRSLLWYSHQNGYIYVLPPKPCCCRQLPPDMAEYSVRQMKSRTLVLCFDGTSNEYDADVSGHLHYHGCIDLFFGLEYQRRQALFFA